MACTGGMINDVATGIYSTCVLSLDTWRAVIGLLCSSSILGALYTLNVLRTATKLARKLALVSLFSQALLLAYVVAHYIEMLHLWATSVLFVMTFYSLFGLGAWCLFSLTIAPLRFMNVKLSAGFGLASAAFAVTTVALPVPLLIGVSALEGPADVPEFNRLFAVFFMLLAIASFLLVLLTGYSTRFLQRHLRQVNVLYVPGQAQDRFKEFSQRIFRFQSLLNVLLLSIALLSILMFSLELTKSTILEYNFVLWFFVVLCEICLATAFAMLADAHQSGRAGRLRARLSKKLSKSAGGATTSFNDSKKDDGGAGGDLMNILTSPKDSIYVRIGGDKSIDVAVRIFYQKVLADPTLHDFFGKSKMAILQKKQKMFLILVTGGPALYTGKSLRQAHAHLNLEEKHFVSVATHLNDTLVELKLPGDIITEIMTAVASLKDEILGIDLPTAAKKLRTSKDNADDSRMAASTIIVNSSQFGGEEGVVPFIQN